MEITTYDTVAGNSYWRMEKTGQRGLCLDNKNVPVKVHYKAGNGDSQFYVIPALGRPRQEDYLEFKVRPLLESYFLSCGTIRLINTQV